MNSHLEKAATAYIKSNPDVLRRIFTEVVKDADSKLIAELVNIPEAKALAFQAVTTDERFIKAMDFLNEAIPEELRAFVPQQYATFVDFIKTDNGKYMIALWVEEWKKWFEDESVKPKIPTSGVN